MKPIIKETEVVDKEFLKDLALLLIWGIKTKRLSSEKLINIFKTTNFPF